MNSIWNDTAELPSFPKVEGSLSTDVLIIGGGIAGVLCAYRLKQLGVDYILVEAEKICKKTTANTTAKISSLHGLIYQNIIKSKGLDFARLYYQANQEAIAIFRSLSKEIDCDFEEKSAYIFTDSNASKIEKEVHALQSIGANATLEKRLDIPFSYICGVRLENQAQYNPIKFLSAISSNLNIYENSRVTDIYDGCVKVNGHTIKAKKIIVTTHFPIYNKHGMYFLKMYQHRSYAIAIKTDKNIDGMYLNDTEYGLSLRTYKDTVILGGEGHRTGKSSYAWQGLVDIADKYFPGNTVVSQWAAQDCMTLDKIPYIGQYSKSTPNLYVATGFNKWGMTSSMIASYLLGDLILGKKNKYEVLFSPNRSMLKPQLLVNSFEAILGYASFKTKRCSHLGCALKWNKHERTWDCPCHGSRYTENGTLIDGPANTNLK